MYKPTAYNEETNDLTCETALSPLRSGRREHRAREFLGEQDTDNDNRTPSRQPLDEIGNRQTSRIDLFPRQRGV